MSEKPRRIQAMTGLYYDYVRDWTEGEWCALDEHEVADDEAAVYVLDEPFVLPDPDDRLDGMGVLAFHRGRWRHVVWSSTQKGWSLGYGAPFILDADRAFAPLPQKPDGAPGFYDFKEGSSA